MPALQYGQGKADLTALLPEINQQAEDHGAEDVGDDGDANLADELANRRQTQHDGDAQNAEHRYADEGQHVPLHPEAEAEQALPKLADALLAADGPGHDQAGD